MANLVFAVGIPIIVLALLAVWLISEELVSRRAYPRGIPWVGKRLELFPKTRANWRGLTRARDLVVEGYTKYSKNGELFFLSNFVTGPEVLVPLPMIPILLAQPDNILSPVELQCDVLQVHYTLSRPHSVISQTHSEVIRKSLTRHIRTFLGDIMDEISATIDELWGHDTEEWREVIVFEDMKKIITRATNRILVGPTLCRNEDFLDSSAKHSQAVMFSAMALRCIPNPLKPLFGRIITIPNHYYSRRWGKHLCPILRQRLADTLRKLRDEAYPFTEPSDFIQWQIRQSLAHPDPREHCVESIAAHIEITGFAGIHTTLSSTTSAIFDLYSSPPQKRYIDMLREEAAHVLSEDGGVWTKTGLAKMVKIGSALRESSRLEGGISRIARKVIAPEGLALGSFHVPQGFNVGAPAWAIHHDEDIYSNPYEYDPLRFSPLGEDFEATSHADAKGHADGSEPSGNDVNQAVEAETAHHKNESLTTTKGTFLHFGLGRHAWIAKSSPGRFFSAAQMKLIMAYILLNYEVQPLVARPPNTFAVSNIIPPTKASIKIRRRRAT
ncbi:MAG: hypothetical protein M1840_001220 [Geoglossum simile]|nr:MAG: hypothetical protein M1840_001220 [Geoglossum simile]